MIFVDTHTHLYLEQFDNDRNETVKRAVESGTKIMLLPNIDTASVKPMMEMAHLYQGICFPMIGLHPTSVKKSFHNDLIALELLLKKHTYCAIGEIGIDLYWDITFKNEQKEALRHQIKWAHNYNLPIVIHSRNALDDILNVLNENSLPKVRGVFHCYPGDSKTAEKLVEMGFMIGIGGVVTYKNSKMPDVIRTVGLNNILLETDAPYLTPIPFRGQRNESAYIPIIAQKISDILQIPLELVANQTTMNARKLFNLNL
ncbi:MAG: TatD family hydrolase [Bacteroidales bacterium]|nr:TatD family hydrolase [Bacteroidales bacterium]